MRAEGWPRAGGAALDVARRTGQAPATLADFLPIKTQTSDHPKRRESMAALSPRPSALPAQPPKARWHQAITGFQARPSTSSSEALAVNTQRSIGSAACTGPASPSGSSKYITLIMRR